MTDAALWAEIDALLADYGYPPEDREAMRLKFFAGRRKHGNDLRSLDCRREAIMEAYDLPIYGAIRGVLHDERDSSAIRGLLVIGKLALQHAKRLPG